MRKYIFFITLVLYSSFCIAQTTPSDIQFTRQAVKRIIFDQDQTIQIASLNPSKIIGFHLMHPITHLKNDTATISLKKSKLNITSPTPSEELIWLAGFNPFATYSLDIDELQGEGKLGFQFADPLRNERFIIYAKYKNQEIIDVQYDIKSSGADSVIRKSIYIPDHNVLKGKGKLILQMLGSGLTVYHQDEELPIVVAQLDFSELLDLRTVDRIQKFQTSLYTNQESGVISIKNINIGISAGMGLADIRAITYENGDPYLDMGRIWYTMSIRGRALPHPLQGVFSMNPSTFDIKFEGAIIFDREDGLWRNEVASHLFYDRKDSTWKGITTGFSAYANKNEKKQLLAIHSKKDPRFGFSIMKAKPLDQIGDIEDPHILYDQQDKKWRILTCTNIDGYKAILLESENWDKGYKIISGPVKHNSTGTSIQKIDGKLYCFSGSSEKNIFIYSYPKLKELGHLKMDLPPWDQNTNSRVWPNVVELPDGYPAKYIALMMDRINYPGIKGPQWTYGALYLYYGHVANIK